MTVLISALQVENQKNGARITKNMRNNGRQITKNMRNNGRQITKIRLLRVTRRIMTKTRRLFLLIRARGWSVMYVGYGLLNHLKPSM